MATRPPEFFDATAMPDAIWWEALWPDPAAVIAAIGIDPGMDVIDLCAGDGWFTLPIARIAKEVIALDIDRSVLEVARHRLTEAGVSNCRYIEGDAFDLAALAGRPVDHVVIANAFHGVPDKTRLAESVRGALKPSGQLSIVNWHTRPREQTTVLGEPRGPRTELRLSPQQTVDAVVPGGFRLIKVVEIPPFHYGAIFERLD